MLDEAIDNLDVGLNTYQRDLVTHEEAEEFIRKRAFEYLDEGYYVPNDANLYWEGKVQNIWLLTQVN